MFFRAIYLNNTTVLIGQSEGLPNITGEVYFANGGFLAPRVTGVFSYKGDHDSYLTGDSSGYNGKTLAFNASDSNSIYGNSEHVTPINASVKVWQRIS